MSDANPRGSIKLPVDFFFREVHPDHRVAHPAPPPAPLGPLGAFVGDWVGNGFNTIFRPENAVTPTPLQNPVPPPPPGRNLSSPTSGSTWCLQSLAPKSIGPTAMS